MVDGTRVSQQFEILERKTIEAKSLIERFTKCAVRDSKAEIKRRIEKANKIAKQNKWNVEVAFKDHENKAELTEEIIEEKMQLLMGKQGKLLRTPAARHTVALYK
ncbi:hypothetical protein NEUTE2DRAFT_51356 [Neurospora tetrasperma FGSC 2509]|nr:hypothetical protein NEUTE2DRAFT_51356 [Neurospora tetrasperma FGSC 2509]